MAAVFALLSLAVIAVSTILASLYVSARVEGRRTAAPVLRVPLAAVGLVFVYLVVKLVYEELIPCVAIDAMYCDFDSTQYWNLFGWEF